MTSRVEQNREPDTISNEGEVGESRRVIKGIKDPLNDIVGTPNQVVVTVSGNQVILSLPQDIDLNADVEFDSIVLDNLIPLRMVSADASSKLISISDLTNWIAGESGHIVVTDGGDGSVTLSVDDMFLTNGIFGTTNQVIVTDNLDGTVTLSTPQDIDTGADVEFGTVTIGDMTPTRIPFFGVGGLISEIATFLWDAGLHLKADALKLFFGAGDDLSIYYDGTDANIKTDETAASDLKIECGTAKTLELQSPVYEDLQVSISTVRLPTSQAPTWRQYNHGIAAGVTFPVLGFALNELIYFDLQTSHSMKLSTILDNHIHFMTPTDGSATPDRFQFQLDVIVAPIHGNWAVPTGSPFTSERIISGDYSNSHEILEMADIPASNTTVSTVYKCKLTRIAATQDEYSGEIYIEFTDSHYQKNTMGSRQEGSK